MIFYFGTRSALRFTLCALSFLIYYIERYFISARVQLCALSFKT
jgi:hypothetical protein